MVSNQIVVIILVSEFQDTCLVFQSVVHRDWMEEAVGEEQVSAGDSVQKPGKDVGRASSPSSPHPPNPINIALTQVDSAVPGAPRRQETGLHRKTPEEAWLQMFYISVVSSWLPLLCWAADWRQPSGDLHPAEVSAEYQSESLHHTGPSSFAPLTVHFLLYCKMNCSTAQYFFLE